MLDKEMEPALLAVLQKEAADVDELRIQFQLVLDLLREDAEDKACVLRQAHHFKFLLDRYFGTEGVKASLAPRPAAPGRVEEDGLLNEAILDSLPDRVAVIATDYRYIYSNPLNAQCLGQKPIDLVGRHIVEFIGEQRFEAHVKRRLDRCFAGETVEYEYISPRRSDGATRCRMTPCISAAGNVLGAILVLQEGLGARGPIAA